MHLTLFAYKDKSAQKRPNTELEQLLLEKQKPTNIQQITNRESIQYVYSNKRNTRTHWQKNYN